MKESSKFSSLLSEVARTPSIPVKRTLEYGDRVGEYIVLEVIGQGGFGTVYRAVHPVLRSEAAIKVLSSVYAANENVSRRFVEEARAIHRIRHPNIVELFGFGELPDGRMYYTMELLSGDTLSAHLMARGAFEPALALAVLRQVADALDTAHAYGVLHRDLKHDNIFVLDQLTLDCRIKLLDFGVAKVLGDESELRTRTGVVVGTPGYMSPEQCGGQAIDAKSDIYALGVVAFELLTGKRLFEASNLRQAMAQHMFEDPPRASAVHGGLPPSIDGPLLAMLHKQSAERPASAAEAVAALSEVLLTPPTPSKRRPAVHGRSHRRWTLGVLGVVTVAGALWVAQWLHGRAATPRTTGGRPPSAAQADVAEPAAAPPVDPKRESIGKTSTNALPARSEATQRLAPAEVHREPEANVTKKPELKDARRRRGASRPPRPASRRRSSKKRAYDELEF